MDSNLMLLAVEMILDGLQQNKTVIIYGTGTSMDPTIHEGDALVVMPPNNLEVGDIIVLLINPNHLVVHRIIDIGTIQGEIYIQTKGDNLKIPDPRRSIRFVKGKVIEIKKC